MNDNITVAEQAPSDERALAAQRLLERKRLGLESAIEALEAVGYAVSRDGDGTFVVSPPAPRREATDGPSTAVDKPFLGDYPDLLTPAHIAEITGFTVVYVRRLCRERRLPAVQIGSREWLIPKPRFVELVFGGNITLASGGSSS